MRKGNMLKKKLKEGKSVLGTWTILPSSAIANVLAASGLDFVVIDMEHGPINFETAEDMVRAAESEGCSPLIRVPKNDEVEILRALDIGAHGVVVPHIETVEQKNYAIASIKYFPIGSRGLSPFTRAGGYAPEQPQAHTEKENKETMSILIIEGKEGIKNLESIIEGKDIDVVYVGIYDLSQSLGLPGQVNHPEVKKQIEVCVKKIRNKNIAVGSFTNDIATLKWFKAIGMQFLTYSLDATELCLTFKNTVKVFKGF